MDKSLKKWLMPILAIMLCAMMALTCVYISFATQKQTNIGGEITTPKDPSTSDTAGGMPLPSDHDIKKVDSNNQLPIGKVSATYTNNELVNPVLISNKYELMAWLLSDKNAERDAKLVNNITFDWTSTGSDAPNSGGRLDSDNNLTTYDGQTFKLSTKYYHSSERGDVNNRYAMINAGRTLDGFGFSITYNGHNNGAAIAQRSAFFAKEINGTMKNITFDVPKGYNFTISNNAQDMDFNVGFLCIYMRSSALLENVKVDFAATFGKNVGSAKNNCVGIMASENAGTLNYCEVNLKVGADIKATADQKAFYGAFGGRGFIGDQGARINNCVYDHNYNSVDIFKNFWGPNALYATAIFGDGSNANINGFITKNADIAYQNNGTTGANFQWKNFVGTASSLTAKNLYLLNNQNNLPNEHASFVRIANQTDYDLNWDRFDTGRLVIKNTYSQGSEIFWDINQQDGSSYNDIYKFLIDKKTSLSMSAFTPAQNKTGGSLFEIKYGELGKMSSSAFTSSDNITSVNAGDKSRPNLMINTAIYDGREYSVTVAFSNASGNVTWNDTSSYGVYYKDLLTKPVMPNTYITTIKAKSSDQDTVEHFSYFDNVNRRIVVRDDNYTADMFTLTIKTGTVNIISKTINGAEYIDKEWTSVPIQVVLEVNGIKSSYSVLTRPNIVKITFDTKEDQANGKNIEWIEQKSGNPSNTTFLYSLSLLCSDKPIRFAFFRDNTQLTEISEMSVFSKVDTVIPTFELDEKSHRGDNPIRDLNKWMDRYNADGNADDNKEVSQVWIRTRAGVSGANLSVRARKLLEDGSYDAWGEWGAQLYQPLDNGSIIDSTVFAQVMYDSEKSREENAAYFNGEWELEFKVVNGAGKSAIVTGQAGVEILSAKVKVDYSNYYLDSNTIKRVWHGSDHNQGQLVKFDNSVCDIVIKYNGERDYFFRNEPMTYDLKVKELRNNLGFTLATANGIDVPKDKKFAYLASYNHDSALDIGVQPDIAVSLKQYIKGGIALIDDKEYGMLPPSISDKVTLPAIDYDGTTLVYSYTTVIKNQKDEIMAFDNIKLPVGKYNIAVDAVVNTGNTLFDEKANLMYDIDVQGTTYNVTPKMITLSYVQSSLSSALRNFNAYTIKYEDFSSFVVAGDKVAITGILPTILPTEGDLANGPITVECFATLNNANYAIANTCFVTLAIFTTDTEDPSIFLIESTDDFLAIKDKLLSAKFKLRNDLDFKSKAINGLGEFTGIFDGNGYAIQNLKILSNTSNIGGTQNVGLFAKLGAGAEIKNLVISNMIIDAKVNNSTNVNVGAIAGEAVGAKINNVSVQGVIYALGTHKNTFAGALVGRINKSEIKKVMTFTTLYLAKSITDISKQNIVGGGLAGELKDSTLTNIALINQGYINTSVENGAGYIASVRSGNTVAADVNYLKNSILNAGQVLASDSVGKVYADFLTNTTKYGELLPTFRGGRTFKDIMNKIIPSSMRTKSDGTNDLTNLTVSNHRELVIMLNYNFADYKITKDIYCFNGFNYSGAYKFAGKISNANGYKIYTDNGVYDIGN